MKKKLRIDPNQFALAVIGGSKFLSTDDREVGMRALERYIVAYGLAQQFNEFLKEQSSWTKNPNFDHIIKVVDKINLV